MLNDWRPCHVGSAVDFLQLHDNSVSETNINQQWFVRIQGNSSTDQFGDKTIRRQGRTIRWTTGMIRQHDKTTRWQFYQFGDKTIRQLNFWTGRRLSGWLTIVHTSDRSPNIRTVKPYFHTPAPGMPCRCGRIRCRCVSMRADAVDAVISHTRLYYTQFKARE